ncbi:hypothetical protein [Psychromonas sp. SR45-3]|uniref:hypothetical protein n=1 Tax=Psychromonas sp. SR45-3 TaxID=2760930 RepID=UPI0015FCE08D|nr:hypothetical protein [Psychromonas sp. SR45-3]MBB1274269.1 hypothetical protein [Psychromonas sp. SR45-3]
MRTLRYFHKAPLRVLRIEKLSLRLKTRRAMIKLKIALAQEKQETILMLTTYKNYTQGLASKAEMKMANEQMVNVLKGLGLGVFAILPFAPITIPIIIKLGRLVGVEVMPSAFIDKKQIVKKQMVKKEIDKK